MERNGDELCWMNDSTKKEFRMKANLTPDQWAQASFCVYLRGDQEKESSL
jgi:hypothetical protein